MLNLKEIKNDYYHAKLNCCSENGCKLKLDGMKTTKYVILKGEMLFDNKKMCDCIIFKNNCKIRTKTIIGIIELKSNTLNVDNIIEKMDNSSLIALNIKKHYSDDKKFPYFYHLLLYKNIRFTEYQLLKNKKIIINGVTHKE